jgi:hypothetical protein
MAASQVYSTAYVTGSPTAPTGTDVVGNIMVVVSSAFTSWSSYSFVGGLSASYDTSGYVIICDSTTAGVIGRTTGNNTTNTINAPAGTQIPDKPTFWVSNGKNDQAFLILFNSLPPTLDNVGYNTPTTTPAGGRPYIDSGDVSTYGNITGLPNNPYTNPYDAAKDWLKINGYWTSYT